jgi:hypothetical protein
MTLNKNCNNIYVCVTTVAILICAVARKKKNRKEKKRLVACFYIKNARFLFSICLIVFINVIITEILVYRQKENYRYHIPFILTNLLNT